MWGSEVSFGGRSSGDHHPYFFKHIFNLCMFAYGTCVMNIFICVCLHMACVWAEVSGQLLESMPSFYHEGPRD